MEQLKIMIVIIVGFYLIHSINKCIEDKKNNKNEKTIEGFIADITAKLGGTISGEIYDTLKKQFEEIDSVEQLLNSLISCLSSTMLIIFIARTRKRLPLIR